MTRDSSSSPPTRWEVPFIGGPPTPQGEPARPVLLRTSIELSSMPAAAALTATSRGVYQVEINGTEIDDHVLKPGWTSYQHRLLSESTDVTHLLHVGQNTIGVWLAGGWYTEAYGFLGRMQRFYGNDPSFSAVLTVDGTDGQHQEYRTGQEWSVCNEGPILASGIYSGETADLRRYDEAWATSGPDAWVPVTLYPTPEADIIRRSAPPVRRERVLAPQRILTSSSGGTIVDFGQNFAGRVRISPIGSDGDVVTLRHAEELDEGELATRPLRGAAATDTVYLAGAGTPQTWEPRFTFHGFRYVEVAGWPGELTVDDIKGIVLSSDLPRTSRFSTSHPLLNRFHENVVWSARSNFLSIPSDCPQRDERLGWTGDVQLFAPAAATLMDCESFLSSWLDDVALEQSHHDGIVPVIVPNPVPEYIDAPVAAWGDAATVVPWTLWQRFGNIKTLSRHFPSMKAWVDAVHRASDPSLLWRGGFQFGDWLDPSAPADQPGRAMTDPALIATAYAYASTAIVAKAADVLGYADDAHRYSKRSEQIRNAFRSEFVTPSGRLGSHSVTAYAVALIFELGIDNRERAAFGQNLAELVRANEYRVATGFVGTAYVLDALVDNGYVAEAGRLLLQSEHPSWLSMVRRGATTIWERWDSRLPDGTINPGEMTSFNHYSLGSIADFLYRRVAGIAPLEPGYTRARVQPVFFDGLDSAEAQLSTRSGDFHVAWQRISPTTVKVTARIPDGTDAEIDLPGMPVFTAGNGDHEWSVTLPPIAPATPITLDSSLGAIADDPRARETVFDVLSSYDGDLASATLAETTWTSYRTVRSILYLFPLAVRLDLERRLAALSAGS